MSDSTSEAEVLDAGSINVTGFPGRRLQRVRGQRLPSYQTIIQRHVLASIHEHGKSSLDAEICGVLVGNVYRDLWGLFLLVDGCVAGDRAENKATQVTFKAETWTHIHEIMERDHPHQKIVGWYHTHPGFGIFLSGMDLFIQDHFFNLPWQVALVYDPIGEDEGVFVWRKGKSQREEFLIQDVDSRNSAGEQTEADEPLDSDELSAAGPGALPRRSAIGRGTWALGALFLIVCLVAAYYVLSVKAGDAEPAKSAPPHPAARQSAGR